MAGRMRLAWFHGVKKTLMAVRKRAGDPGAVVSGRDEVTGYILRFDPAV